MANLVTCYMRELDEEEYWDEVELLLIEHFEDLALAEEIG